MSRFTFNRGDWDIGQSLPDWDDDDDSISYMVKMGYSTASAVYGNPHGAHIEIFESGENDTFYAFVTPTGTRQYEVYIPDFQSYMIFIKDYATPFAARGSDLNTTEILQLLNKLFRVQHGHDANVACPECDPEEYERRTKAKRTLVDEL